MVDSDAEQGSETWISAAAAGRVLNLSRESMRLQRDKLMVVLGGRVRSSGKRVRVEYLLSKVRWYLEILTRHRARIALQRHDARADFACEVAPTGTEPAR